MSRKSKDSEVLEPIESAQPEQPPEEVVLVLKFEDLTVTQKKVFQQTDSGCSIGYVTAIDKKEGGISDHTYINFAAGIQKNWLLLNDASTEIDTGSQHGNRPFHWEGNLVSGLYTLVTGPKVDYEKPKKYRVPGRGYRVQFRI